MESFKLSRAPKNEDSDETKKCSECLADIPQQAKKCSHCGSKQKAQITKRQVITMGVFALLVVIFFSIGGEDSGNKSAARQQQPTITDSKAHIMAQNYVESVLKSPSTADFPSFDYQYSSLGGNKHKVVSYVDAQNSFGAEIRSNYSVTLTYNGGEWADINNWTLNELIFDGEVVYSDTE